MFVLNAIWWSYIWTWSFCHVYLYADLMYKIICKYTVHITNFTRRGTDGIKQQALINHFPNYININICCLLSSGNTQSIAHLLFQNIWFYKLWTVTVYIACLADVSKIRYALNKVGLKNNQYYLTEMFTYKNIMKKENVVWRDSTCNGDGDDGGDDDDNDDDDDDERGGDVVATVFPSYRYRRVILRMSMGNSNHDWSNIQ